MTYLSQLSKCICNENEHTIQYRGEKSFIVYLHNISRVSTHLVLVTAMFSIESEQYIFPQQWKTFLTSKTALNYTSLIRMKQLT